jgi:hypothetical protein
MDPYQGDKSNLDPDPHRGDADPQHWVRQSFLSKCFFVFPFSDAFTNYFLLPVLLLLSEEIVSRFSQLPVQQGCQYLKVRGI